VNINWKVRVKNKAFWITLIPAVLIAIQAIAAVFGITLDLGDLGNRILIAVDAIFVVLALLGIVLDPTTAGVSDSTKAMSYNRPKVSKKNTKSK
jgi:phi LC3 family holin